MASPPTKGQRERWSRIVELGCAVEGCPNPPAIHHCGTGMGGRKDHDRVLGLCHLHHQGKLGVHTMSRRVWQARFGTEDDLMARQAEALGG